MASAHCGYVRLAGEDHDGERAHKGQVPLMVGKDEEMKRVLVPARLMNHPYIVGLLEISAGEYGYDQPGAIKVQCDVQSFKRMIGIISKDK
ncbi:hypothetical protein NMG60_11021086 [Bertholletia excelsa]